MNRMKKSLNTDRSEAYSYAGNSYAKESTRGGIDSMSPTRSGMTYNTGNTYNTSQKAQKSSQMGLQDFGVPGQGSFNPSSVIGPNKGPGNSRTQNNYGQYQSNLPGYNNQYN